MIWNSITKKTKIKLQLIRWKVKLKSLHQNVQSIHRKTREAVGFEPTIFDIHIISPIHWATNQTIKIIIINTDQKSIFFHLWAKITKICIFCLEMEKNWLLIICLIDGLNSLGCGRVDLIVGCCIKDLRFESRYPSLFYLSKSCDCFLLFYIS